MAHIETRIRHVGRQRPSAISLIAQMIDTSRQRKSLRNLDPVLLRDLGITPEAAQKEANRPFWDLPTSPY